MSRPGSKGLEKLAEATAALDRLKRRAPRGDSTLSEHAQARTTARSAMDWLEDTDRFETAHRVLDEIGKLTRTHAPSACSLEEDEGQYFQTCPVSLAHSRVGLSPGLVVEEMKCSICSLDPRDCAHISGEAYDGVEAHRIITKARILEVNLVARPAQPDARLTRVSVTEAELREALGRTVDPGTIVTCDRCLSTCEGVRDSLN